MAQVNIYSYAKLYLIFTKTVIQLTQTQHINSNSNTSTPTATQNKPVTKLYRNKTKQPIHIFNKASKAL